MTQIPVCRDDKTLRLYLFTLISVRLYALSTKSVRSGREKSPYWAVKSLRGEIRTACGRMTDKFTNMIGEIDANRFQSRAVYATLLGERYREGMGHAKRVFAAELDADADLVGVCDRAPHHGVSG